MTVADCDAEAKALISAYAREGEYAVVVRTHGTTGKVACVCFPIEAAKVATWLEEAAKLIDNGPA